MLAGGGGTIEFRLLGSVEAIRDGHSLALGGPRQQAVLALLLLAPGRVVSGDWLAEELWRGEPPPGAAATVRVYVSRLRSVLGDDAPISRNGAGYILDVQPEQVDAHRFERLLADGREALERGASSRAASRLGTALELWRGRPFGGFADEGAFALAAKRLEELQLLAFEDRIEADLQLGRDAELVDELELLLAEQPYRERLWRQLMLALYRAGRQADALAAYRRARKRLDDELGVEPSEELRALEQAILRHEVPAAESQRERHNLPAPLTSFVGRVTELSEIAHLLEQARLATLTGVGGVGKTRLGLEAARNALSDFPGGVWFCDLSVLTEPEAVPRAVAAALEVGEPLEAASAEELAAHLRDRELLLVVDNCEHLREPVAVLAHRLLTACPRLRLLATSREPLGTPGEVEYEVTPLPLPPVGADDRAIRSSAAVQLFLQRARATRARLADDEQTLRSIARVCADLDGLPLALELAAARAKTLSPEEIANHLADRFRFLVSWRRLATARHRTLREAMDWSYELLNADERAFLLRLSVFAGGFTLPAAAAVCADGDEERALVLLERVVGASLVVAVSGEATMRYHMLETVRQYASERLAREDAVAATRVQHASYFGELAERRSRGIYERGGNRLTELVPDDANLRAALRHFRESGSPEDQLRLCAALWRYWWQRGQIGEGRQLLAEALKNDTGSATAARAEALRGASTLALRQGDYRAAAAFAEEGVAVSIGLDEVDLARARVALANVEGSLGKTDRAAALYDEAAAVFRAARRTWELGNVLLNLGDLALNRGDLQAAERAATESLSLCRALGEEAGVAVNLGNLAFAALERGDPDRASAFLVEALERSHAIGFGEWVAIMLVGLATVAARGNSYSRAAKLLGAAERLLEEVGASLDSVEARVYALTLADVRERLGDEAFAAAVEVGRGLPAADVVELATSGGRAL